MLRGAIGARKGARVMSLSGEGGRGDPPVGGHGGPQNKGKAPLSPSLETLAGTVKNAEENYYPNSERKSTGYWRNSQALATSEVGM